MNPLDLEHRSVIERTIAGALKSAIDAHSPITIENRTGAAKRVFAALKDIARNARHPRADLPRRPLDESWPHRPLAGKAAAGDDAGVPRISTFYGIVIAMYYAEHGVAHFHALYGGEEASIAIDTLDVLAGTLPDRALRLVREWAELHRVELQANWQRARDERPLEGIDPLT